MARDPPAPTGGDVNAVSGHPLPNGVTLTVVRDRNGWRFHGWTTEGDQPIHPSPSAVEQAQRFATADGAAAYFRTTYASLLRAR